MNVKKLVGLLVIVFVLFWIISRPNDASGSVNTMLDNLKVAGNNLATFMSKIL